MAGEVLNEDALRHQSTRKPFWLAAKLFLERCRQNSVRIRLHDAEPLSGSFTVIQQTGVLPLPATDRTS